MTLVLRKLLASSTFAIAGADFDFQPAHLFVEETGLPLRTFVLWLRLTRSLELFASGASLTDAAHDAGFADSAHLSRTFRRMFGIAAAPLSLA